MKTQKNTAESVLLILLKEPFKIHTATSITKFIGITRQGVWKTLSKLAKDKLISLSSVGDSKTSTAIINLNWLNPVTEKTLSLLLTKESIRHQRWIFNFEELESHVKFLVLFGSVLINSKEANDIDILAIVDKRNFKAVDEKTLKIQTTQLKKIHLIDLTESEFRRELKMPNKAYLEAIKKGVVLYGHESFIKFIRELGK